MFIERDLKLSHLSDERENLRIQLSLAADVERPDTRMLLLGRARLILLEAEIGSRRRMLRQVEALQPSVADTTKPGNRRTTWSYRS